MSHRELQGDVTRADRPAAHRRHAGGVGAGRVRSGLLHGEPAPALHGAYSPRRPQRGDVRPSGIRHRGRTPEGSAPGGDRDRPAAPGRGGGHGAVRDRTARPAGSSSAWLLLGADDAAAAAVGHHGQRADCRRDRRAGEALRSGGADFGLMSAFAGLTLGAVASRQGTAAQEATRRAEAANAVLAERSHIAREIHDILAHSLSAQIVHLEGARLLLSRDGDRVQALDRVERARNLARSGLEETRRALATLRGRYRSPRRPSRNSPRSSTPARGVPATCK